MALTKGEIIQVLGRTIVNVGEELEKDDEISKEDIFDIIKNTVQELLKEYAD